MAKFDALKIKNDFPCLQQEIYGKKLVFLDSAASAQKPKIVIDNLVEIYSSYYANIHRGIYYLSAIATNKFEETRNKIAKFINAKSNKEIIFTKGATEAINLVVNSYAKEYLKKDDEIIISEAEHHANIVPWQHLTKNYGLKLKIARITDDGDFDLAHFKSLFTSKTKFVSIVHISNAIGSIFPIKDIIEITHQNNAKILIDASQSIVHKVIDVQKLNPDFLVFSGHKLYGPNGTGVLYGKYEILESMSPYQFGGEMITNVEYQTSTYGPPPLRFEAGTPIIAEIIAFGKVIDYLDQFDRNEIYIYEQNLLKHLLEELNKLDRYKIIAPTNNKAALTSFIHDTAHSSDIGALLDHQAIAIRTGHHCAMPLMKRLGISSTARISFALYNTHEDIEVVIAGLKKIDKIL